MEAEGDMLKDSDKNARVLTTQAPSKTRQISQLKTECPSKPSLVLSSDCPLCGWDALSEMGQQVPLHWAGIPPGSQQVGQAGLTSSQSLPLHHLVGTAQMFALLAVTQSDLLPTPQSGYS